MKKTFFIFILISLLFSSLHAELLQSVPMDSTIKFTAKKMDFLTVDGEFKAASVVIDMKNDTTIKRIEAKIDTNSISTGIKIRDRHLKDPHFFDSRKYLYINFSAKGPIKLTDKKIKGELNIRNKMKVVDIPVSMNLTQDKKTKEKTITIQSEGFKINRAEFDVNGLSWLVNDTVDVSLFIVAKQLR